MVKLGSKVISFIFVSLMPIVLYAQTVEQKLSNKNLEIGDQVTLTIEIQSSEEMPEVGRGFSPPVIEGLDYMGVSESSGTSINIINFKKEVKYTKTLNLSYACMKEGNFTIPSIALDYKNLKTQAETFKVFKKLPSNLQPKNPTAKKGRRGGAQSLFDHFFGFNPFEDGESATPNNGGEAEFFVRTEVDKKSVFEGEQFVVGWYIYTTPGASLHSFDTLKFPTLQGFWKEDIEFASRFNFHTVILEGKRYSRALLASYALTPYNPGEYEIDAFELRATVSSGFFRGKTKTFKPFSEVVKIMVKPLPEPKAETFSSGVGRFIVDQAEEEKKEEVLLGEPYPIEVKIIGDNSATKFIEAPKMDLGEYFKLYNVEEEYRFIPRKVSSYKKFTYSVVPKKEGLHQIPDIAVTFLNPNTEPPQYYTEYIKMPILKVLPNDSLGAVKDENYLEEVPLAKDNLLKPYEDTQVPLVLSSILYRTPGLFWGLGLFLSLVLSLLYFIKFSKVKTVKENFILEIEERIKKIKQLIKEKQNKKALDEIINIYSRLLGAVSGKRYGVEEETLKAIEHLPTSLKEKRAELLEFNSRLQKLRFDSGVENSQKGEKLSECLQDFQNIYSWLRPYLP